MCDKTIAAVATPVGEGGIGIIRISGSDALNILKQIFISKSGFNPEKRPRELIYGHILDDDNNILDEVLAVYFPAPKTYTTEPMVEIDCHGGNVAVSQVLELVIKKGGRIAEPGEFTKRAFLNGRIDLAQAEAVIDVIDAKTELSAKTALNQLRGKFSDEINLIRNKIVDILVEIDVNIDYPDEDIEEIETERIAQNLKSIEREIDDLLSTARTGKIIKDGLKVTIVGKPNVGKSSLLNGLLRESRAIVTEIPGTTRDIIEEFINIKGIPVKITDTAGIRETEDIVEKIGIDKSKRSLEESDLNIMLLDSSIEISNEDKIIFDSLDKNNTVVFFNKSDKDNVLSEADMINFVGDVKYIKTSMKDRKSIEDAEICIFDFLSGGLSNSKFSTEGSVLVANARHKEMLERAKKAIADAIMAYENQMELEVIELDIREAYEALGLITGDSVQDDVIGEIFKRFCLGK